MERQRKMEKKTYMFDFEIYINHKRLNNMSTVMRLYVELKYVCVFV